MRFLSLLILTILLSACNSKVPTLESTPPLNQAELAASYNAQLGLAYLEKGNIARAKHKLLTALELAPDYPPALDAMAYYQEKTGNLNTAQHYYQKSLHESQESGTSLNNYGAFLCRNGQYPAAINYFIRATTDPKYLQVAGAYENAGLCALKIPDESAAIIYFEQALQEDPKRPTALLELAKLTLNNA